MGRYYWGSIEGKFWVAVQPSSDIENLVNCEYQQHYCWEVCGCTLEEDDHQRVQKQCTLECEENCIHFFCKDCFETQQEHYEEALEEGCIEEGEALYHEENSISYNLDESHYEELVKNMEELQKQLPTSIVDFYKTVEHNEKIIDASFFYEPPNTISEQIANLEEKELKKVLPLIARYQLGLQIKYCLKKEGSCSVGCEI